MSGFEIRVDASKVAALANNFHNAQAKMPAALASAVNAIGPEATAAMKKVLPGQTGLKAKVINKALKGRGSGATYVIRSHGGDIRLKYFMARETSQGVTAAPWNSRRLYPATFIKSGWWPNRVAPIAKGQVLRRKGPEKNPMEVVKSGLFIPEEMVKGASAAAFYATVDSQLPALLEAALLGALTAPSGSGGSKRGTNPANAARKAAVADVNQRYGHVSLNDDISDL